VEMGTLVALQMHDPCVSAPWLSAVEHRPTNIEQGYHALVCRNMWHVYVSSESPDSYIANAHSRAES
jgi:hypothetical protein